MADRACDNNGLNGRSKGGMLRRCRFKIAVIVIGLLLPNLPLWTSFAQGQPSRLFEAVRGIGGIRQIAIHRGAGTKYRVMVSEIDSASPVVKSRIYNISDEVIKNSDVDGIERLLSDKEPLVTYLLFPDKLLANAPINPGWFIQTSDDTKDFASFALKNLIPMECSSLQMLTGSALEGAKRAEKQHDMETLIMGAVELKQALSPGVGKELAFKYDGRDVIGSYDIGENGLIESVTTYFHDTNEVIDHVSNKPANVKIDFLPAVEQAISSSTKQIPSNEIQKRAKLGIGFELNKHGWLITHLFDGFPAKASVLKVGDVITRFSGLDTTKLNPSELPRIIEGRDEIEMSVMRANGEKLEVTLPVVRKK